MQEVETIRDIIEKLGEFYYSGIEHFSKSREAIHMLNQLEGKLQPKYTEEELIELVLDKAEPNSMFADTPKQIIKILSEADVIQVKDIITIQSR